jgi:hypothetical protein
MNEIAAQTLERLRADEGSQLNELARLVVVEATSTPVATIASPRWLAGQIATALEAATHGDLVKSWALHRIQHERDRWSTDERALETWIAPEVQEPIRKVLGRPYAPSEDLVMQLIDHGAIHDLMGQVLSGSLSRFSKRVRNLDDGVLGGIGGRAARRGKRLFGGLSSGLADNLVGAVKDEIDQAMENRVAEFAAQATGEALRTMARYASDPVNAQAFADLRLSLFDYALQMPMKNVVAEADKLDPETLVEILITTLRTAVSQEDFVTKTEERIAIVLEEAGDGTLGAWLDEVGLTDVWVESTTELIADRLKAVVKTPSFEDWWSGLFEP